MRLAELKLCAETKIFSEAVGYCPDVAPLMHLAQVGDDGGCGSCCGVVGAEDAAHVGVAFELSFALGAFEA